MTKMTQPSIDQIKHAAQSRYADAKDTARTTYAKVQSTAQDALEGGIDQAQELFKHNTKGAKKKLETVQDQLTDMSARGRKAIMAQGALQIGLQAVQELFKYYTSKSVQRKAQKNFERMQSNVQENMQSGLDIVSEGAQKASKAISQVPSKMKDIQEAAQDRYAEYRHNRKIAKMWFRWGLFIGLVLCLLYTPIPGSDTRHWLMQRWQQYRTRWSL